MHVTKVRHAKGKVVIIFDENGKNGTDVHILTSDDAPTPEFAEALQGLVPDLAKLCEIPNSKDNPITVRQISLRHTNEGFSAVISGVRDLVKSNGVLVLNSPNKNSAVDDDTGSLANLSKATTERIEAVLRHAAEYVEGKRQQLNLFNGGDGSDGVPVLPNEDEFEPELEDDGE